MMRNAIQGHRVESPARSAAPDGDAEAAPDVGVAIFKLSARS